jgi:hypothetical protein
VTFLDAGEVIASAHVDIAQGLVQNVQVNTP